MRAAHLDDVTGYQDRWTSAVGWYQVIGGAIGVLLFAGLGLRYPSALPGGSPGAATLPFAILAIAGWLLAKGERAGLLLSLILQAAQSVAWSIGGSVWKFSAGVYASLGVVSGKPKFFLGWDTSFLVGLSSADQPPAVLINVVAAALLLMLGKKLFERGRSSPVNHRKH